MSKQPLKDRFRLVSSEQDFELIFRTHSRREEGSSWIHRGTNIRFPHRTWEEKLRERLEGYDPSAILSTIRFKYKKSSAIFFNIYMSPFH